jgi:hypothetical protein
VRRPLFRVCLIFTLLYCAVGVALTAATALTQGTGWMHFTLPELLLVYLGLFSVPLTLLLWLGWAVLRHLNRPHAAAGLTLLGIALPLLYVLILFLVRSH